MRYPRSSKKVYTLTELMEYVDATNKARVFDVREPSSDYPYEKSISEHIVDIQRAVSIAPELPDSVDYDRRTSALLVITAFIVQRILWSGSEYRPERIAINSANVNDNGTNKMSRSSHRQIRRQMKEKLILKDIAADMFDEDSEPPEDDYGIESNYTVQSTDGREMARSFHVTSRYPSTVSGQETVNSFQRTSRYQSSGDGQEIPQTFQRMSGYQSSADEQERMQSFQRTSSYQSSTDDQERPRSFQRTSSYQSSADEQETPRSIPLSSEYQSRIKADMEISNQVV
uniref:Uncharacterized protein n=1 Tax=Magallana gigas TaxID=29159 RepID=A0A8W8IGL7_MAGGI|nr:uncharacterized protein LOC117689927 [Crassostrea gigas]